MRRRAAVVGIVVVLACAAAAALAWTRRSKSRGEAIVESEDTPSPLSAGLDAMPSSSRRPTEDLTPSAPDSAADVIPDAKPAGFAVRGTVQFKDGSAPPSPCLIEVTDRPRSAWAEVTNGRFELTVPWPGTYEVSRLFIEADAYPTPWLEPLELHEGSTIAITLEPKRSARLLVVDHEDDAPLRGAFAFEYPSFQGFAGTTSLLTSDGKPWDDRSVHPRRDADDSGSIRLSQAWMRSHVEVGAPGHERQRLTVSNATDEPIRVELLRTGSLDVAVANWMTLPASSLALVVNDLLMPLELQRPDDEGRGHYDGIPPGSYRLILRGGDWRQEGPEFASTDVGIVAGQTVSVALNAVAAPEAPHVDVKGTIRVPAAWESAEHWSVGIHGCDPRTNRHVRRQVEASGGSFTIDDLPAGRYRVDVVPVNWATNVEVRADVPTMELNIPPQRSAEVAVRDAMTHEDVVGATVGWSPVLGDDDDGARTSSAVFDARRHLYVVEIPAGCAGRLEVFGGLIYGRDCDGDLDIAAAGPPTIRREILVHRTGRVHVVVQVNEVPVDDVQVVLTSARGALRDESTRTPWPFDDVEPGRYHVSVVDAPGFAIEPPREVDVKAGETTEVTFDLKRK